MLVSDMIPLYVCSAAPKDRPTVLSHEDRFCPWCGKPLAEHRQTNGAGDSGG